MSRNRHEEDEASEIRLETLNLRESPASCNYHVCQPARAPSPDSPFCYPCVPHSRLPLSPPSPSPPVAAVASFSSLLSPCALVSPYERSPRPFVGPVSPFHSTDRPSSRPSNPCTVVCAERHPRSRPDETPRHSRRQRLW